MIMIKKKYLGPNSESTHPNIIPKKEASTCSKSYVVPTFWSGLLMFMVIKNMSSDKRTQK